MTDALVRDLVTILFGALAGGLTNGVAIWMLFHPYVPPKVGRWRVRFFQGAVPKNQPRLAAAIGRTVGNRLLTSEDLTRTFADVEFRSAFDKRLGIFLDDVLERERGSIRDLIPAPVLSEVEAVLDDVVELALSRLAEYLASERFEEAVERRTDELVDAVADEPIGDILTPARGAAVEEAVNEWLGDLVESEDFQAAVEDYIGRASRRLLAPSRTFEEILPRGLVGSMEKAIAGYLPLAIARLGKLLEDPRARLRLESTLHDLLHRFLQDLKFHQRVVARLVMTEDTVEKVLDTIETEGADRLSEILRDPAVQDAMARGVNDAIVDFLRRPVTSVLGDPEDPDVLEVRATLTDWVVGMARDPSTREFLVEKLHAGLEKAGDHTWGDVLHRVPRERVTGWIVAAGRSEPAARAYKEGVRRLANGVLDRPIGTPARWLPEGAPQRLEEALGDPIWEWMQTQVPDIVQRIDVARRVEEKVLDFPTARMEELVRKVTDRELRLIVKLGYALGGLVGLLLVVVNRFLR
ncbi:MAG: DUF445 family protein [Gemmatimonadetes bacterium]|nr:DUF445 family protein [Gemmatimonadota bacterium]